MVHQFQFVNVSNPTQPVSSKSRKSTQSHVMRQAHARKRRLQIQKYQDESVICGTRQDLAIFKAVLPSPLSQGFTNSEDPFSSLAQPLKPEEYFLLDHCMFIFPMPNRLPCHYFVIAAFSMGFFSTYTVYHFHSSLLIISQISKSWCRIR